MSLSSADGVVTYGYDSTYGVGNWNASQIRVAYRGCDGMSISFASNTRNDRPQVLYGASPSALVSLCLG